MYLLRVLVEEGYFRFWKMGAKTFIASVLMAKR